MSIEEARELGKRSIYHATYRDSYSGGVVNCKLMYYCTSFNIESLLTGNIGTRIF